jgi:hypothetical protein
VRLRWRSTGGTVGLNPRQPRFQLLEGRIQLWRGHETLCLELRKTPAGQQVVGSDLEYVLELGPRFLILIESGERPAQGDSSREKGRVVFETGETDPDGLVVFAGTPQLLGERRKSNRRRVLLNPAPKHIKA